jgi:leader peptidase (prepilin peptidase)/N-methyltransferase
MSDAVALLVLLVSAPVGSFLCCYADRTCRGLSLVAPSRCESCAARITPRDLVPVFSWLLLRGRCRVCGARLRPGLLIAEILAFAAALLAVATTRETADLVATVVFLWCLLGLAQADLACFRLPDTLTLALFLAGLALAQADPTRSLAGAAGSGMLAAGLLVALRLGYRALRRQEGLGLGDVKLAAGLGAGLGAVALPWLGLIASASALLAAGLGAFGPPGRQTPVPFGVFLCMAAAAILAGPLRT